MLQKFKDVIIDGRKNNSVILFCDENLKPENIGSVDIITVSELENALTGENGSCTATLDRLLSRNCNFLLNVS